MAYWQPSVDLYRGASPDDGWIVKVDLAGVQPNDVEVRLEGRRLEISGVRRDRTVQLGCVQYRMEISYSRFERILELPEVPEPPALRLEQHAGMLLIRIEKDGGDQQ